MGWSGAGVEKEGGREERREGREILLWLSPLKAVNTLMDGEKCLAFFIPSSCSPTQFSNQLFSHMLVIPTSAKCISIICPETVGMTRPFMALINSTAEKERLYSPSAY